MSASETLARFSWAHLVALLLALAVLGVRLSGTKVGTLVLLTCAGMLLLLLIRVWQVQAEADRSPNS